MSADRHDRLLHASLVRCLALLVVISTASAVANSPMGLPSKYHVSGVIQLPYAEISEPFESWIDVDAGYSRIDYYGGAFLFCPISIVRIHVRVMTL